MTGVRNFEQARHILTLISHVLEQPELTSSEFIFVSSTASGRVGHEVELAELALGSNRSGLKRSPVSIRLQYGHFPSLIIRHSNKKGCIQLFCSGKFNIVGCSKLEEIDSLWSCLAAIMRE